MNIKNILPLDGLMIGLSGAIPERSTWQNQALDYEILNFVRTFSGLVMKYGGVIVHGAHPAFSPILLKQAKRHYRNDGTYPLHLVMSNLWAKEYSDSELEFYEQYSDLTITRQVGKGSVTDSTTINDSLSCMRKKLIPKMDLFIAIGGKLHSDSEIIPGVEEEYQLAKLHNIPCIMLPALEGKASDITPSGSWIESIINDDFDCKLPSNIEGICSYHNLTLENIFSYFNKYDLPRVTNIDIEDIGMYPSALFNYCIQYRRIIQMMQDIAQKHCDS